MCSRVPFGGAPQAISVVVFSPCATQPTIVMVPVAGQVATNETIAIVATFAARFVSQAVSVTVAVSTAGSPGAISPMHVCPPWRRVSGFDFSSKFVDMF